MSWIIHADEPSYYLTAGDVRQQKTGGKSRGSLVSHKSSRASYYCNYNGVKPLSIMLT